MEQIRALVTRAASAADRDDRIAAYGRLVDRFKDMACGYAYSLLGDFHLAEDAAQDAFVAAYRMLDQLRQPEAFAGWFRRIVWSACGRISRRPAIPTTGIDAAGDVPAAQVDPSAEAEKAEMRDEVLHAISQLPAQEREVTTLFYINGYSQKDIADFLEVPVGTVKNRLTASRGRLKERMLNMVKDTLHQNAPDERFDRKVIDELLSRPRLLEIPGHPIRQVWEDFRACLPGFQVVDFEEIVSRISSHLAPDLQDRVGYGVDEGKILRTDLSDQLVRYWIDAGGGECRLITAGRTFRKGTTSQPHRSANLFHQAEVLWVAKDLNDETPIELARKVTACVLRREAPAFGEPVDCGGGIVAREVSVAWQQKPLEFGVAGYHSEATIRRGGLASEEYRALCLCFGLDRCAVVRYDLDDIRKLWQPPYVK